MNNIKIGDLVTAYRSGFHEVVDIIPRWKSKNGYSSYSVLGTYDPNTCGEEMNSLIKYKQVYDKNGKPKKTTVIQSCDSAFCRGAIQSLEGRIKETEELLISLKLFKKKLNEDI